MQRLNYINQFRKFSYVRVTSQFFEDSYFLSRETEYIHLSSPNIRLIDKENEGISESSVMQQPNYLYILQESITKGAQVLFHEDPNYSQHW